MELLTRSETEADYRSTEEVIRQAFADFEHSDGSEPDLVARLRREPEFVPELSLVAEVEGRVVGHILFTPIRIVDDRGICHVSLALAPVSVIPALQRKGVGTALILEGHKRAAQSGYASIIVLGRPGYYPRFGYAPASERSITAPFDVPDEAFMALELIEGGLKGVSGRVSYPSAFQIKSI